MTPGSIVAWFIIAVLVTVAVPYFIGRRALHKKKLVDRVRSKALWERLPIDEAAREVAKEDAGDYKNAYWHEKKYHFDKHGHKIDTDTGEYVSEPSAARLADRDERSVGKHPALGMGYGRQPSVFLTARQLERVNIARLAAGKRPLNRDGFTNAVAHASGAQAYGRPQRQPQTGNDWLTYLILYECLFADHTQNGPAVGTGLTVTPDAPFNGHGGDFAGAGASGDWTNPDTSTASAAVAIATGSALMSQPSETGATGWHDPVGATGPAATDRDGPTFAFVDPLSDPNSFKGSSDNDAAQQNPDDNTQDDTASGADSSSSSVSDSSASSVSDSSASCDSGGGGGDGS